MKTIIIGDIHGRSIWKQIVESEKADLGRVVFVGDYFDTHEDISAAEQMYNFKEIVEFKETSFTNTGKEDQRKTEVVLLIGNHDHHYFPEIGDSGTSGYQRGVASAISILLSENREHLQMAYRFDNIVCSHAGIGEVWLKEHGWNGRKDIVGFVNDMWKYKPRSFLFDGYWSQTGDDITQTPIWIRPASLLKSAQVFKRDIIQVVGHTSMSRIDIEGKSTGGRYYFIDTLGTSGEYLIVNDGEITSGRIDRHQR